ncbi:hypothetical protein ACQUJS_15835 [Ralstonia pseudosolanacearum]
MPQGMHRKNRPQGCNFRARRSHCADTARLQRGKRCVRYNADFLKGE